MKDQKDIISKSLELNLSLSHMEGMGLVLRGRKGKCLYNFGRVSEFCERVGEE